MASEAGLANLMLGSQLVCKSIRSSPQKEGAKEQTQNPNAKKSNNLKASSNGSPNPSAKQQESKQQKPQQPLPQKSQSNCNNNNNHITKCQQQPKQASGQKQQVGEQALISTTPDELRRSCPETDKAPKKEPAPTAKEFEQLTRETQEMKTKMRKLQLEIDEKNEIISVLRDELETTKEQSDKFQRDNIQLLKDSKRVKFLQDELDFLQDKVGNVDKLELELKRLKEKLAELDFLKLRIGELEEDKSRAQEESSQFEAKWRRAELGLARVAELEAELGKWKSFSHELESERSAIKTKLLESIDQEAKLNQTNKKVEDEVRRLRSMIRSLEEEREEEQASNSLIMSAADLKQVELHGDGTLDASNPADSSIKFELEKQIEKGLNEENRSLKQKLDEQEAKLSGLVRTNREICDELDGSKKLISDLRQDLACEKNLAQKLSKQLGSFERQIRNLDKQYFHSHEDGGLMKPTPCPAEEGLLPKTNPETSGTRPSRDSNPVDKCTGGNESSLKKSVTPVKCEKQKPQDALTTQELRNPVNDVESSNNDEGINMHNENASIDVTKEDKAIDGCKSSVNFKQVAKEEASSSMLPDNSKSADTRLADKREVGDLLKLDAPVLTNKSSAALEISNKDKDRAQTKGVPSPASSNSCAAAAQKLVDQHEPLSVSLSLKPLIDSQAAAGESSKAPESDEASGTDQGERLGAIGRPARLPTSCSSDVNCGQSPSPSAPVTVGHDSGFQSINNVPDFSQISPSNDGSTSAAQTQKPTAEASTVSGANADAVEKAASDTKQNVPLPADQSTLIGRSKRNAGSTTSSSSTRATVCTPVNSAGVARNRSLSTTPTRSKDKVPNAAVSRTDNPFSGHQQIINGSQAAQHQSNTDDKARSSRPASVTSSASAAYGACATDKRRDIKSSDTRAKLSNCQTNNRKSYEDEEDESGDNVDFTDAKTSAKTKARPSFVRNSMSSRSVNFGHLSRSSYLDKIRASVIATATTNTTSSFNEQQTQNIVLAQAPKDAYQQQPHHHHHPQYQARLNCMLKHQHMNSCFTAQNHHTAHLHPHPHHHHSNHPHPQQPNSLVTEDGVRSSRQLNALIDPTVSDEHLVHPQQVSQFQLIPHQTHGLPIDTSGLTEQQMAHLAHQHYFHHLEHMRQLHHMHHQHHMHLHHHRMHHKYQQQHQPASAPVNSSGPSQSSASAQHQHQQKSNDAFVNQSSQTTQVRQREPVYTGGSQFYAPSMQLEQVYAHMSNNNNINQANERTRLVNNSSNNIDHIKSLDANGPRSPPNKLPQQQQHHYQNTRIGASPAATHKNQAFNQCALPQIDEVNGLASAQNSIDDHLCKSRTSSSQSGIILTSDGKADCNGRHNDVIGSSPNDASPSSNSSSPTSSNSSNLSPSSASSSSSLNSLTTSNNTPLSRSTLRHSTIVDSSRRQFSVERELINNSPMTATLSRVGSCRADGRPPAAYALQHLNHQAAISRHEHRTQNISLSTSATQVRSPMRSSPLQSSKMLACAQSPSKQHHPNLMSQQQFDHLAHRRSGPKGSPSVAASNGLAVDSKLASNLAGIKLNDSLAFTSLRVPKGSPRASGLNCSLDRQVSNGKGHTSSTFVQARRPASSSSSPEKQQLANAANQTNDQANSKSSVWFEYGCV